MVNSVILVGRITQDVELKYSNSQVEICNFSLAVRRNFKNREGEYDTDFVNCVAFGKTATLMDEYVSKGNMISVEGRIQTRNYEDTTGRRVYVTEVIGEKVTFLETKQERQQEKIEIKEYEEDLPF